MTVDEQIRQAEIESQIAMAESASKVNPEKEAYQGGRASPLDVVKGLSSGALTGATWGLSDEIAGAVGMQPMGALSGEQDPMQRYSKTRDFVRGAQDEIKQKTPASNAVGDILGSFLSGKLGYDMLKRFSLAPKTALGSMAGGMAEGGLQSLGRGTDAEDVVRRAVTDIPLGIAGGLAGHTVAEGIGRLNRSGDYVPTIRHQQAKDLGVELSPAQKYDDRSLQQVEAGMRADPGYSKSFETMDANNQTRANEIAANSIGIEAKSLTDEEMGLAAKNIRDKFNEAKDVGESVTLDDQWLDDLGAAQEKYNKAWGVNDKADPIINDALAATEKGVMSPTDYQYHYSRLGKKLDTASKAGDSEMVSFLVDMRRALDNVLDRSYPNAASKMQEARNLFKNKLLLQRPGVLNTGSGDVSPLSIANKLSKDIKGYVEGGNQSDLYNLGRVSQAFKSNIGNSGTATRNKGMLDWVLSPAKESMGNMYLGGKYGTGMMGGTTGVGARASMPIANTMLSEGLLDLFQDDRR